MVTLNGPIAELFGMEIKTRYLTYQNREELNVRGFTTHAVRAAARPQWSRGYAVDRTVTVEEI